MRSRIWLSYDLGVRGDYSGLYTFLDSLDCVECGDNMASCMFEHEGDLLAALERDIRQNVEVDKRTRIYVVYPNEQKKFKGRFLIGGRKPPAWAGYAGKSLTEEDDSE